MVIGRTFPRRFRRCASTCLIFIMLAVPDLGSGRLAAASFAEGLAAFDAGDYRAAYNHWRSLAEAGNPEAQVALAGLLESGGPGVGRDVRAAADWYRKAALAGDAVAQMNLAQFYAEGRGVRQDRICALAWFTLAAKQGRSWAAARRNAIASLVSAAEQLAAESLASRIRSDNRSPSRADPCAEVRPED
jgi:TPR repeat protein